MERFWRFNRFKLHMAMVVSSMILINHSSSFCTSLNTEGLALLRFKDGIKRDPFGVLSSWNYDGEVADLGHCSWFGVECSDGKVIILNLRDMCLEGVLSPEMGKLSFIKSINLRNNSFNGMIPREIGDLKELEELDLGYNNFTGQFPSDLVNNLSLSILLLDHNNFLDTLSPEVMNLKTLSEFQVDENQLTNSHNEGCCNGRPGSWNIIQNGGATERKLLQVSPSPSPSGFPISSISLPPSQTVAPSLPPVLPPLPVFPPARPLVESLVPMTGPALAPSPSWTPNFIHNSSKHHKVLILSGIIGGSIFILFTAFGFLFCKRNEVVTVKPWATGLSGQLQKAFTTGVPSLQRAELVTACEDFSNIIGSMLDGTVYKGTLSSGVEIAVTSTAITSNKDWNKKLETKFRNKIEMLSKVNHKNFVNLIGYCEEQNPFTRMMVFEYAPNGTLFEHIHIKEAEHLDWSTRLRIAMGIAYCLEYLHQLDPPVSHKNLNSSSIYLTEDYAAKISDFSFWDATKTGPAKPELLDSLPSSPQTNVYSFGVILFELVTGKMVNGENSVLDSLKPEQPITNLVDPSLSSYDNDMVNGLLEVVKMCVVADPFRRPEMRDVTGRMKDITDVAPENAIPRSSPLWWAELEILSSTESN